MINTSEQIRNNLEIRLKAKTLDDMFYTVIKDGTNCSAFESRAILENARSIYRLSEYENAFGLKPGQLKVIGIDCKEPAGKPLSQCKKKEAIVTLDAGDEDHKVRFSSCHSEEQGVSALRRFRLPALHKKPVIRVSF